MGDSPDEVRDVLSYWWQLSFLQETCDVKIPGVTSSDCSNGSVFLKTEFSASLGSSDLSMFHCSK